VEKNEPYDRIYYRARWNHRAYMGRLAVWLIWVLLIPGIIFFTMFVSGMPASVPEARNGFAMMMTLVIFVVIAFLAIVRHESVAKLKEIADFARRVETPSHPAETFLYDATGNMLCHGADILSAPWGFPRDSWQFLPQLVNEEREIGNLTMGIGVTLTLREDLTPEQLVRVCPFGPKQRRRSVTNYVIDSVLPQVRMGKPIPELSEEMTSPWEVGTTWWPIAGSNTPPTTGTDVVRLIKQSPPPEGLTADLSQLEGDPSNAML